MVITSALPAFFFFLVWKQSNPWVGFVLFLPPYCHQLVLPPLRRWWKERPSVPLSVARFWSCIWKWLLVYLRLQILALWNVKSSDFVETSGKPPPHFVLIRSSLNPGGVGGCGDLQVAMKLKSCWNPRLLIHFSRPGFPATLAASIIAQKSQTHHDFAFTTQSLLSPALSLSLSPAKYPWFTEF